VVAMCIAAGLVGGEAFSVDASLIEADVGRKKRVPGDQPIAWPKMEEASRAVREYLAALERVAGAYRPCIPRHRHCRPGCRRALPSWQRSFSPNSETVYRHSLLAEGVRQPTMRSIAPKRPVATPWKYLPVRLNVCRSDGRTGLPIQKRSGA
jgi:hypothetical protein